MRLFAWCRVFSPWEKRRERAQRKVDFFSWVYLLILKSCISQEKEIQENPDMIVSMMTRQPRRQLFFCLGLGWKWVSENFTLKKNASWSCENGSKKNSMDYESKILVKNVNFETRKNRVKLTIFLNGISSLTQQHFAYFS